MCIYHKKINGKEPKVAESRIRRGNNCNFSKAVIGESGIKKIHEKSRQTIENNIKNGKMYNFLNNSKYKCGWYKGIYCDSSWELAFVIYCLEYNLPIKRCKKCFKYTLNNKTYRYYPDFEINDEIYEIKGREDERAKAKQKAFPNIKVLHKKDLKPIFAYVKEKYGKNFIKLYE